MGIHNTDGCPHSILSYHRILAPHLSESSYVQSISYMACTKLQPFLSFLSFRMHFKLSLKLTK